MRARMALAYANITIELREILLSDRPDELYVASSKGTVPVLQFSDGSVIDESFDIMKWCLEQVKTDWLDINFGDQLSIIKVNDEDFKSWLNKYKYHQRHPEQSVDFYQEKCVKILLEHEETLSNKLFLFGEKPSSADFAIYGQLTQLINFDPTSRKITYDRSLRLVSWLDIMTDLSGHDVDNSNWTSLEDSPDSLKEIMKEFGKMYVPALLANARAIIEGEETWETEIDGSLWKQKTFPYQAKCLNWIKEEFDKLNADNKSRVRAFLDGTGCEQILG